MVDTEVRILHCPCKSSESVSHTMSTATRFDSFNDKLFDLFTHSFTYECACTHVCENTTTPVLQRTCEDNSLVLVLFVP